MPQSFAGRGFPEGEIFLRRRAARLLPLVLAASFLAGCASADPISVPLAYDHEVEPDLITNIFPMFLSGFWDKPESDETRGYQLWPLYKYERNGREERLAVFGTAYFYSRRFDHRGFEKLDVLIPPVFYGRSADQGNYLAILPFGGTTKGVLGKSYALWFLFPLYLYTEDNRGVGPAHGADVFVSQHVLFPFVNWWSGDGHSGFRVFPFYAHYKRVDHDGNLAFDRTWILWPFFTHQRNALNTTAGEDAGIDLWFLFPFWGQSRAPRSWQWSAFFGIVNYAETETRFPRRPFWRFKIAPLFVPILSLARGEGRSTTDVWPFFGVKTRDIELGKAGVYDHFERTFILWPFIRWEHHESDSLDYHKWWFLPFFWHYRTDDKRTGGVKNEYKIWPLFRYKEWPDGRLTVNIISPLWFNDPEGAFEKIYNPLFRIYERGRTPEGDERRLYAWGLVQQYDNSRRSETWVHPFLYWNEEKKDGSASDDYYLFGLFQVHRRGNQRALRFFWLPEWPTWRTSDG
jgi:hypothetical protein